jgi:hypothetical protein
VNLYKVLTFRTLAAVSRGEPCYWRLSDPLRWPLGIRGSILAVMDIDYLVARLDRVVHWCPLDSGGLRLGYQRAPDGVRAEDLLLGRDSQAELIRLGRSGPAGDAVAAGRQIPQRLAGAEILEAFRAPYGRFQEWTYEVFIDAAAAPSAAEISGIYCANTAAARVRDVMGAEVDGKVRTFNPRWSLDRIDLGRHPVRRRV